MLLKPFAVTLGLLSSAYTCAEALPMTEELEGSSQLSRATIDVCMESVGHLEQVSAEQAPLSSCLALVPYVPTVSYVLPFDTEEALEEFFLTDEGQYILGASAEGLTHDTWMERVRRETEEVGGVGTLMPGAEGYWTQRAARMSRSVSLLALDAAVPFIVLSAGGGYLLYLGGNLSYRVTRTCAGFALSLTPIPAIASYVPLYWLRYTLPTTFMANAAWSLAGTIADSAIPAGVRTGLLQYVWDWRKASLLDFWGSSS